MFQHLLLQQHYLFFLTHTSPKFVFCWYYFSSKYNVVLSVYTLLLTICIISVLTNSAPNGLPITLHYECDTDYNESNSKLVLCRHYDGSGTHTWAKTFTIKWLFMFFLSHHKTRLIDPKMWYLGDPRWRLYFTFVTFKHLFFPLNWHYWWKLALVTLQLHF